MLYIKKIINIRLHIVNPQTLYVRVLRILLWDLLYKLDSCNEIPFQIFTRSVIFFNLPNFSPNHSFVSLLCQKRIFEEKRELIRELEKFFDPNTWYVYT